MSVGSLILQIVITTVIAGFLFYWSWLKNTSFRSFVAIVAGVFGVSIVGGTTVDLFRISCVSGFLGIGAAIVTGGVVFLVCYKFVFKK